MKYIVTIPDEDHVPEKDAVYLASAIHHAMGEFTLEALVPSEAHSVEFPNFQRVPVEFDAVEHDGNPPEASGVDWSKQ